ncbi:MAG: multi-sensor signal transduction histidine kinase [Myxococcales bacterium]|nr:multi-sensor signal transduction histidine kinase [Myxococcales bacterium]
MATLARTPSGVPAPIPSGPNDRTQPFAEVSRTRLTYVMLFRVGLVTLLLASALIAEVGAPSETTTSPVVGTLLGLIVATYALTIAFALVLKRARNVSVLAALQVGSDLVLTTMLVHLTGRGESAFAFMYIIVIVGAAFVLGRIALAAASLAIALYLVDGIVGVGSGVPVRALVRSLAVNAVAFAATGALATRLAAELRRAGEHLVSQGVILRDLAALHEDVIRGLTSGLVTIGTDGRVLTFNTAAAEIVGRRPGDAVGRPIAEVMPGLSALQATIGDGALRRGEIAQLVARGDGVKEQRTLGVSLSPLVDSRGQVLGRIVNFQDLTELRRMEAAVQRAEQLAAVGRLAAGIAHEIRNPLAAISGSIELLSQTQTGEGARENRELMSIVIREVERLNGLITELLEFARPRSMETQRLDAAATMAEMLRVFENDKRLGGARVELLADDAVEVDADPAQLRQVVWNLLRNAAEAAPDQPIVVEVRGNGAFVKLTVRDRGPGISEEHRARLFEPFFSTKEGGTGLGLATVHRIIEEHKGSVEIDCPTGGGTAITVRLPRAR